jgi:hypothetical protein
MRMRVKSIGTRRVQACFAWMLVVTAGGVASAAQSSASPGFNFGGKDRQPDSLRRVMAYQASGSQAGAKSLGAVEVWSGADGSLLSRLESSESDDLFGFSATSAGDLDGDGYDDVIVGSPLSRVGGRASGRVDVISAVSGKVLLSIPGAANQMLGLAVHGLGDLDGDGVADIAASGTNGRGSHRMSHLNIYSGASGKVISSFVGGEPGDNFGSSVTNLGDRNGDGLADIAILAPAGSQSSILSIVSPMMPEAGGQEIDLLRRVCEDHIDIITPIDRDIIDRDRDIDPGIDIIDVDIRFRYPGNDSNPSLGRMRISADGQVTEELLQSSNDLAADVNKDGLIDDADTALVASNLYRVVEDDAPVRTDLNHDGFTDAADLTTVLVSAYNGDESVSPAVLDGMHQRDEQKDFLVTLLATGGQLSEEEQVVATVLAGCQGCPPCPIGNPNDPSDDQWPDGASRPGAGPNDPWVECFHCRCCGPGYWAWQTPTQSGTAAFSSSDPYRSGGGYPGNPGSASAWVYDALPRGFWTVVETSTAIAAANWNFSQATTWLGAGPPCGASWSATPQGTGSSAVNVSASAYPGVSSSASASGGGGASALGANFSFNMPTITLTATYAGLNANGDYTINVAGNGGATQTSAQGAATVSVSTSTNWTVVGTGSASGNASFFCANPTTTTKYCQLGGYTGSTNGVATANGTGTGVWGIFSNAYASYNAYASVSFQY